MDKYEKEYEEKCQEEWDQYVEGSLDALDWYQDDNCLDTNSSIMWDNIETQERSASIYVFKVAGLYLLWLVDGNHDGWIALSDIKPTEKYLRRELERNLE